MAGSLCGRFAAVTFVVAVRPLLACTGCVNIGVTIRYPWAPYGLPVLWAWLLAMLAARSWIRRGTCGSPDAFLPRALLRPFLWFGGILLVLCPFLGIGGGAIPGMWAWVLFAVFLGLSSLVALVRIIRKRWMRPSLAAIAAHVSFALVALLTIRHGQNLRDSIEFNVARLDYPVAEVMSLAVPRILHHGRESVPVLIRAARRCLEDGNSRANASFLIPNVAFCLARLGGRDAQQFFHELLRESVEFRVAEDEEWELSVCLAGARLLEGDARDDLMALYRRMPENNISVKRNRATVLCAMALYAARHSVRCASAHFDQLPGDGDYNCYSDAVVKTTARTLLFWSDPEALRAMPWFRLLVFWGHNAPGELTPREYQAK